MNPRILNERKKSFCVSSYFVCLKDNNKTAHWVGHLQLKSLYTDVFFKRKPVVDDLQDSLTGNTIEQSASGGKESIFVTRRQITRGQRG